MRRIAAVALAGAIVAFTLPFGAVSGCDGQEVRFTGIELASFDVTPDRTYNYERTLHREVERNGSVLAIVVLLAAALGFVLAAVGRAGWRACGSVGLVAIQVLAWTLALASDGGDLRLLAGFWIALGSLAVVVEAPDVASRRRRGEAGVTLWGNVTVRVVEMISPVIALLWL